MVTEAERISDTRVWPRPLPPPVGIVGLALGAAALISYAASGYDRLMLFLWLVSLAVLAVYFLALSPALPRTPRLDLALSPLLALLFAPLYLVHLFEWPVQVSSDESVISTVSERYASLPNVDPFGVSDYLGRPALLFVFWGNVVDAMGGVDLLHMRILHAVVGLLAIAVSYALFRQLLPRWWAFAATCVFGVSHSMLMISRFAMRENTAVLIEVAALALLLAGLRYDHALATFAGGFVAGLGWYVYQPGRATFALWVAFLVCLALFFRQRFPLPRLLAPGAIALAGFALMAGPIVIAEHQAPPEAKGGDAGNSAQLLLTADGRRVQQSWVFAGSVREGVWVNIKNGLGTFNNHVSDHSWIYTNRGHGFVDPLSGALLWVGLVGAVVALMRRRREPWDLLPVVGFLMLWLLFAFVVNKAPNYTRLLITLPFVAYFAVEGVRLLARLIGRAMREPAYPRLEARAAAATIAVALGGILIWNLAIAWDFVDTGRKHGDDIGTTGRYVAAHEDVRGQHFYLASDQGVYKYYDWGWPEMWVDRLRLFAKDDAQIAFPIEPTKLPTLYAIPPFAIFMNGMVWRANAPALLQKWPQARVRTLVPNRGLVVVEVRA